MDARQKGEFYNPRKEFKLSKEEQQSKLYLTKIKPSSEYFNSGHQKNNIDTAELMQEHPRPVSFISLPGKIPNRWFFLENFFLTLLKETYETLWFTFSFDKIDFTRVKNFLLPFGMASAAYGLESFLSHQIGKLITGSDSFDFIPKLALSGYILNKSAKHCLTNTPTFSPKDFYIATSLELFAIINLYTSTLTGTQKILNHQFDDAYILLTSLALSGLVVPSMIAHWVQKQEKIFFQNEFENGSQRSVSALVSSGLTPAANTFFQFYALLRRELSISRGFQLGLISNNIIVDRGISRQLRNLPSMLIDLIPQVFRKLFIQLDKIDDDFKKNMSKIFVLQLGFIPPKFEEKKIVELKTGDLVWCGKNIDFSCVPISGEIFSFERDFHGNYILDAKEPREVRVNLKNYTGENIWIKNHTRAFNINDYHEIDQRAIQDHKQIGILNGAEIDFLGKHANFFIRIARKKEYIMDRSYEKKSVINEIINQYKTHNIILAVGGSIFSAVIMKGTPLQILLRSVKLLFSIFQMMIPFSESFLREMVNSQIIKKINYVIPDMPLDISDALRICDFWNTLSGYYSDKFPGGAVIISDKTGTLTTTRMKALGIWSKDMGNQIDFTHPLEQFKKSHYIYSSDIQQLRNAFELFASIYTNNNKAFEPEEHAILRLFKKILQDAQCLKIEEVGYHHFKKILNFGQMEKQIETYHLGLFTNYGGRFTICVDDQKKYLLFCGIPRVLKFNNSELFKDYNLMPVRKNVLSRDWCVARREISNDWYENAIRAFHQNDSASIEALLDEEMIRQLEFNCTFLVDNPVKKGVDKFISQCKNIQVPVIIATGDTAKAAQNIARVLCPEQSEDMMTVRSEEAAEAHFPYENLAKKSIIFAGINDAVFKQLDRLITIKIAERPNIIFSEMTTKDKGILIQYFKKAKYFTVANGDGSNDIAMMKKADLVIGHLSDDGYYAPGISQYVNINDKQIQKLSHKIQSCYELFDIHQGQKSHFILPFISLANAQEMVSYALLFKTIKVSMELSKALEFDVNEIFQQQALSIVFDLSWLWISLKIILENAHLPANNQHLGKSWLPLKCMLATISMAVLESFVCYQFFGKTTDFTFLALKLAFLPVGLTSFFNGYHMVQNELPSLNKDEQQILQIKAEKKAPSYFQLKTSVKPFSLLKKKPVPPKKEIQEPPEKKRCCIIL